MARAEPSSSAVRPWLLEYTWRVPVLRWKRTTRYRFDSWRAAMDTAGQLTTGGKGSARIRRQEP